MSQQLIICIAIKTKSTKLKADLVTINGKTDKKKLDYLKIYKTSLKQL